MRGNCEARGAPAWAGGRVAILRPAGRLQRALRTGRAPADPSDPPSDVVTASRAGAHARRPVLDPEHAMDPPGPFEPPHTMADILVDQPGVVQQRDRRRGPAAEGRGGGHADLVGPGRAGEPGLQRRSGRRCGVPTVHADRERDLPAGSGTGSRAARLAVRDEIRARLPVGQGRLRPDGTGRGRTAGPRRCLRAPDPDASTSWSTRSGARRSGSPRPTPWSSPRGDLAAVDAQADRRDHRQGLGPADRCRHPDRPRPRRGPAGVRRRHLRPGRRSLHLHGVRRSGDPRRGVGGGPHRHRDGADPGHR